MHVFERYLWVLFFFSGFFLVLSGLIRFFLTKSRTSMNIFGIVLCAAYVSYMSLFGIVLCAAYRSRSQYQIWKCVTSFERYKRVRTCTRS